MEHIRCPLANVITTSRQPDVKLFARWRNKNQIGQMLKRNINMKMLKNMENILFDADKYLLKNYSRQVNCNLLANNGKRKKKMKLQRKKTLLFLLHSSTH